MSPRSHTGLPARCRPAAEVQAGRYRVTAVAIVTSPLRLLSPHCCGCPTPDYLQAAGTCGPGHGACAWRRVSSGAAGGPGGGGQVRAWRQVSRLGRQGCVEGAGGRPDWLVRRLIVSQLQSLAGQSAAHVQVHGVCPFAVLHQRWPVDDALQHVWSNYGCPQRLPNTLSVALPPLSQGHLRHHGARVGRTERLGEGPPAGLPAVDGGGVSLPCIWAAACSAGGACNLSPPELHAALATLATTLCTPNLLLRSACFGAGPLMCALLSRSTPQQGGPPGHAVRD